MERWKPVLGYEGTYEVSDHGRLRSKDRVVTFADGRKRRYRGQQRTTFICKQGYIRATLKIKNQPRTFTIHSLVAGAFLGPCPEGLEVCHNDGNPKNNHLNNLRYDTHVANHADRKKHGTSNRGTANGGGGKLTEQDVRNIRLDTRSNYKTAIAFGVSASMVSKIRRRVAWAHVTD